MYVTPSGPQSIGGVIDDAIRLYRQSYSRCWLLALLPAVGFGIWQIAETHYVPASAASFPYSRAAEAEIVKHPLPGAMLAYMAIIALLALSLQGAVAARQAAVARGDDSFTFGRALATAFLRLPTLILSGILLYLAMAGMFIAVAIVVFVPVGMLHATHLLARPGPAAMACVVVAVFLAILALVGRLQLFIAAIYIDREGPLASLKSSWRLTRGHWWRATAILATAMIMLMVLYLAVTVLAYLSGYLTHYGPIHRFLIAPLLLMVTYTVIYPLGSAIWVAMYNDFKLRREGGDLAARVGALNSA